MTIFKLVIFCYNTIEINNLGSVRKKEALLLAPKKTEDLIVKKSNYLVEASYRLSIQEFKLVLFLCSLVNEGDEDFKRYRISVGYFADIVGIKHKQKYGEVKRITKSIMEKVILIPRKDEGELQISWLSSAEYFKGGIVELELSPKLKPYLLRVKEFYTRYKASIPFGMKGDYTPRLYELLKQYQAIGDRLLMIDYLRHRLRIPPTRYKYYADFKRKVIIPAVAEINGKGNKKYPGTDIFVEYKEKKQGKKVVGLHFVIRRNKNTKHDPLKIGTAFDSQLFEELTNRYSLTNRQAKSLLEKHDPARLWANLEYVKQKVEQGNIKNIGAYTLKIIKDNIRIQENLFDVEQKEASAKKRQKEQEKAQKEKDEVDYSYYITQVIEDKKSALSQEELTQVENEVRAKLIEAGRKPELIKVILATEIRGHLKELWKENILSFDDWKSKRNGETQN